MKRNILITGAGSGIGHDAAIALAAKGHHVMATTETEEQAMAFLKEIAGKGLDLDIWKLDITNEADRTKVDALPIDILINNAGIGESGPLAEIPLDRLRRILETNSFSTVALTQRVAQAMCKRRTGRLIFVTSVAGRIVIPFLGAYHMSKFALEAAADAFRLELKPFGIDVAIIEPGLIETGFNQRMAATKYTWLNSSSVFWEFESRMRSHDANLSNGAFTTAPVVASIIQAVESRRPRTRYPTPKLYGQLMWLNRVLPDRFKDAWLWSSWKK